MPGRDGTGPLGAGPMTGKGAGNCVGYAANRGTGFGRGMGGGNGLRKMFCLTGFPGWTRNGVQAVDEKSVLKNQESPATLILTNFL